MPRPSPKPAATLTKSKVISGTQCLKKLYLEVHNKELAEPTTAVDQARMDEGTQVGILARKQFPGGVLIDAKPWEYEKALKLTQEAISQGANVLYEAAFLKAGVFTRADVLYRKSARSGWELVEVKSSTSLKEEYIEDVAVQTWVLQGSGMELKSQSVMHLNSECEYPDLSNLFVTLEVTEEVRAAMRGLPKKISEMQKALAASKPPQVDIGPHCGEPRECPFTDHCWGAKKLPSPSIFDLPGLREKVWELYSKGIVDIRDKRLDKIKLAEKTLRALTVSRSKLRWIDAPGIFAGIKDWKWPLYFLDFESIGPAVPRFQGTRPYQQVPFQFSVVVQDKPGGELQHFEYLHEDHGDPRPALARGLVSAIGETGSVVAYYKSAEKGMLELIAAVCPGERERLLGMVARLVDPLPVIRDCVYDIGFGNGFGLKRVAPVLGGRDLSYGDLEIAQGQEAQVAFEELIAPGTTAARREELRRAMLEYCKQDTVATFRLVEWLFGQVGE